MRRVFLAAVVCLFATSMSAQFIIGWSAGYANPKEVNRAIHVYNSVHSTTLTKEMQAVHFNHGLVVGYRIGGSEGFAEVLYTRKVATVSAEADSAGVTLERQMKVLSNTWNFGGGRVISDNLRIGLSFDIGRFKGKGRRGPKSSIGDQEMQKLWVIDNTRLLGISAYRLYLATTIYAEFNVGPLAVRPYFQWALTRNKMDGFEPWLFNGQVLNWADPLDDKMSNAGIMVTLQLGKR